MSNVLPPSLPRRALSRRLLSLVTFKKSPSRKSNLLPRTLDTKTKVPPTVNDSKVVITPPVQTTRSQPPLPSEALKDSITWTISTPRLSFVPSLGSVHESDDEDSDFQTPSEPRSERPDDEVSVVAVVVGEDDTSSLLVIPQLIAAQDGSDKVLEWLQADASCARSPIMTPLNSHDHGEREARLSYGHALPVEGEEEIPEMEIDNVIVGYDEAVPVGFKDLESRSPSLFEEFYVLAVVSLCFWAIDTAREAIIVTHTKFGGVVSTVRIFGTQLLAALVRFCHSVEATYQNTVDTICSVITYIYLVLCVVDKGLRFLLDVDPTSNPRVKNTTELAHRLWLLFLKACFKGIVCFWAWMFIGMRVAGVRWWIVLPFASVIGWIPLIQLIPGCGEEKEEKK